MILQVIFEITQKGKIVLFDTIKVEKENTNNNDNYKTKR